MSDHSTGGSGRLYDCPQCGTVDGVTHATLASTGDFAVTRCAECGSRVVLQ